MEDMIKRIIELDRMAKENLTRANQLKVDSAQKISDIKEQKRAEYLERARANIKSLEKEEKVNACLRLKVIENSYRQKYDRIEEIYANNKIKWVETLVNRVIED